MGNIGFEGFREGVTSKDKDSSSTDSASKDSAIKDSAIKDSAIKDSSELESSFDDFTKKFNKHFNL
jgi:hypothetical protein